MKRADIIFIVSLFAYSFLFWKQATGLNFLIMNVILIGGLIFRDRTILKNKPWLVAASAALFTSLCVFWNDYTLCIFANFIALLLTSSFVLNKENSWFGALGLGFLNAATACAFIVVGFVQRINNVDGNRAHPRNWFKKSVLVLVVLIVSGIFFSMYRGSSLLFESLTNKIDLSFISIGWCVFMGIGTVLLYGFYKQQSFNPLTDWDRKNGPTLLPAERNKPFDALMSQESEYFAGLVLFGILNVMLLLVNGLDIAFLMGGSQFLPDDVTFSEYVHQGVNQLILSIIFATVLILFWFRNYHEKGKQYQTLKWLALLWVLQNMVMIAMTIQRNHNYIFIFGLTYQRIGVDAFLTLALAGLLIVMWKVIKQKSNAFVMHRFGWSLFAMLVIASPVNWDKLIFDNNVSLNRLLDMHYINELGENTLIGQHEYVNSGRPISENENSEMNRRTFQFLSFQKKMQEDNKWPSMNITANCIFKSLNEMNFKSDTLVAAGYMELEDVYYFPCFSDVKTLVLRGNQLDSIGDIPMYRSLEDLDLNGNPIKSINGLEACTNLRVLDLRGTYVCDWSVVTKMPNLERLYVDYFNSDQTAEYKRTNPKLTIYN